MSMGRHLHDARRPPGFTLVEALCALLVLGILLFAAVGWTRSVRERARRAETVRILAILGNALAVYHRAESAYPRVDRDGSCDEVVAALMRVPDARPLLKSLPPRCIARSVPAIIIDPWNTPIRYLRLTAPAGATDSSAPPVFESAGGDRQFGDRQPVHLGDNLRSDDADVLDLLAERV